MVDNKIIPLNNLMSNVLAFIGLAIVISAALLIAGYALNISTAGY